MIKVALPKGRLLGETSAALAAAGWGLADYNENSRLYNMASSAIPGLSAKMFHEKDIPVQVAIGNYDLGICGGDWIEELVTKYPESALVKVRGLGYGRGRLYAAAGQYDSLARMQSRSDCVRVASEYPNLAEALALKLRLRRFSVFPVWGGVEVYPPENADMALLEAKQAGDINGGLAAVLDVLGFEACLIANRASWERKDMSDILATLHGLEYKTAPPPRDDVGKGISVSLPVYPLPRNEAAVWFALPDGHQQPPTSQLLARAGIEVSDYPSAANNRRPPCNIPGVMVKVIRPQDMPLQVANGNFDLAITGRDWLRDHLNQFPCSPVIELADLKLGRVKIVAVVHNDVPVQTISDLSRYCAARETPVRLASEYTNIADRFARDNRLGRYRIVPTWGATEAFLPDDSDILIENTETGQTIARHNLKIVTTLFESTACLIGNSLSAPAKAKTIEAITGKLKKAAGEIA